MFYHRTLAEYPSMWAGDLENQQMPPGLPNVLINTTFGGYLTGGADSKLVASGPMQMTSATAGLSRTLSIAGIAGNFNTVEAFTGALAAAVGKTTEPAAHAAVWAEFWASSDITITAAATANNTAVAAKAGRVTLMDKISRAAFHSMALGEHAIKFNAYGIFSAYAGAGQEDYRIWGECQWFQNIRLPYYHMLADGRYQAMKSLFGFYHGMLPVSKARTQSWYIN